MKENLICKIVQKTKANEKNLRVTLSKIKKKNDLKSIEQAACFYIKKKNLNINVSSIIDDVTRHVLLNIQTPNTSASIMRQPLSAKPRNFCVPKIKWMPSNYYALAERLSDFYGYLFIFENTLRIKINAIMNSKYTNWWETKLKTNLPDIYKYSIKEKNKQAMLPMVGSLGILQPIDYLTVGQLEKIIIKYQNDFIPILFPNLEFFTGHMVIVKRVRNAIAHMAPSTKVKDIHNAKHEIDILLQHFAAL